MGIKSALICAICDRVHVDYSNEELRIARHWDFFVCGMAGLSHADENFVRKTILVTKVNKTTRHDILTGKLVELDLESGM